MGRSYHVPDGRTGFVSVATQVGYAFGLLLFVPLGDVLERRALMMRMYAAVAVALLLVAVAPSLTWLIVASAVAGMLASVTHIVLPIAPDLVGNAQRGRAIGIVMTGLLLGILLARTFAGWVSNIGGWRYVFVTAAVLNAAFVPFALACDARPATTSAAALQSGHALPLDALAHPALAARILRAVARSSSPPSAASGPRSRCCCTATTTWGPEWPEASESSERPGRWSHRSRDVCPIGADRVG